MVPFHPVVLEKKFVLHISHRGAMLNYVPGWRPYFIKMYDHYVDIVVEKSKTD
jgi:hypothetical protein